MICYNVRNARKAFNALAESLDAVSRLPLSRTYSWASKKDRARNIENIANIIDLYPDADRIRAPFERAVEIANTARDEETATALRKLLAELQTAHEKLTGGEKTEREYKTQLADVAASVRGMLADIAEDGTKRTDTATTVKITAELQPKDRKLLIDTKKAAQRADIQSKHAADNSQGARDAAERTEAKVEEAQEAANRAGDNSQAAVEEICEWREYIKQLVAGYDGDALSPSPLTANKQKAIYDKWNEYAEDCKRKHKRATYEGCLDEHGADETYKGQTLLGLVQTANVLEKVVHNLKEQARRK